MPVAGPAHTPRMKPSFDMPFASAGVGWTGATACAAGAAGGCGAVGEAGCGAGDEAQAARTRNGAVARMDLLKGVRRTIARSRHSALSTDSWISSARRASHASLI